MFIEEPEKGWECPVGRGYCPLGQHWPSGCDEAVPKGSLVIINVLETHSTVLLMFLLNSDHGLRTPILI